MANRNWASGGKIYSMHVKPILIDCNFIVDSTNGNGLGIRNLKGPCVASVYMNTSATPATGNPNPEAGIITVQLNDNYNKYFGGFYGFVSPLGSSVTATTANTPAVITSLGTATPAQWQAVGLNPALTPTVGQAFVATSSATIGGSATVAPPTASGIDHIEIIGDPNGSIAPTGTPGLGAQFTMQCLLNSTLTAPANGTVISLAFYLSDSSITIQGE